MKKSTINLSSRVIIEAGEMDAIISDGVVFIPILSGLTIVAVEEEVAKPKTKKKAAPKKEEPVSEKPVAKKKAASKKKKVADAPNYVEVEDVSNVEEGDTYAMQLPTDFLEDGDDPESMYMVEVTTVDDEDGIGFKLTEEYPNFDVSEFDLDFDMFSEKEGGKLFVIAD